MTAIIPTAAPHRFSEDLNAAQYAAVAHPFGALLALAGPGTGKTRMLIHRVAWLLDQGVSPASILMLTFSNSAADEMLTRAAKLAGRTSKKLCGGTFHSVAHVLLRQYGHYIGLPSKFVIIDRTEAESIIGKLRTQHFVKGLPGKAEILDLISAAANRMQPLRCSASALRVVEAYFSFKTEHCLLDFDDLLLYLLRLLSDSETAREKINAQFQHILVDEYQDTNLLQTKIVRLLAPHGNVTAVGDDAQAVYAFRGADSEGILRFPEEFPGCAVHTLRHNYRSLSPLIAFSNAVIPGKDLYTDKPGGTAPLIVRAADDTDEAGLVASKISLLLAEGMKASDIAVLFRSGFHAVKLELEFARLGIAYDKRGGVKVSEAAHVKDVLAFFRVLLNPRDMLAWRRIFLMLDGVGEKTASSLAEAVLAGHLSKGGPELTLRQVKLLPKCREGFARLLDLLSWLYSLTRLDETAARVIAYLQPLHLRNPEDADKRQRGLERLADLISGYTDMQMLVDDLSCSQPDYEEQGGCVNLCSIHAAKCREWRAVFIIGLTHGLFPDHRVSDVQMDEERRLFYVAVTRAAEQLFLSWPRRIMTADRQFGHGPMSPFLRDVPPNLYRTETIPF